MEFYGNRLMLFTLISLLAAALRPARFGSPDVAFAAKDRKIAAPRIPYKQGVLPWSM